MRPTLLLSVAAVAVLAVAPVTAQEVVRESAVFDIEFLIGAFEDHPGPDLIISNYSAPGMPMWDPDMDEESRIDPEVLLEMIRVNIDPDSWSNSRNRIDVLDGKLRVTQTPDNLKRIAALLDALKAQLGDFVEVEGYVLSLKDVLARDLAAAMEAESAGAGLAAQRADALLSKEVDAGRVRVLETASVLGFSGQRVHTASLSERAVVRDVDVEVASDSTMEDPIVGKVSEGFVLDVRPTVGSGELGLLLDLDLCYLDLEEPIRTTKTGLCMIDLPAAKRLSVRTTITLPDGGAALFMGSHPLDGGDVLAFLVRARRKGLHAPDREEVKTPKTKRVLRLYNVRVLTATLEDYEADGPEMGLRGGEDAGAAPAFLEEEAIEGVQLSGEELIDMIRHNIEEDSWSNERNAIYFTGGCLVVVQTEEVQAAIDAFLKKLRQRRVVLVRTTARYFSIDDEAIPELLPGAFKSKWTHLDPASRNTLFKAAALGTKVQTLALSSHMSFNRQRSFIGRRDQTSYVGDHDVEVAQHAGIHDPILRTVADGMLVEVNPSLAGDEKHVTLDLKPVLAVARKPFRKVTLKAEKEIASIELPDVRQEAVRTAATLPDGGAILFMGGRSITQKGRRLVLVVSVRLIRPGR